MKSWKKKSQKLKQVISYFGRTLKLLSECGKGYIFFILTLAVIFSVFPSVSTLIMREIINTLQVSSSNWRYLWNLLFAYILIDIIQSLLSLASSYCESRFQMKGSLMVNMSILEKVKEFSLKDFEDSEIYDLLQRAMKVTFSRIFAFFKSFVLLFQSLINILLFSLILILWKWWLIPVILIVPIVNAFITAYFGKKQFLLIKHRAPEERKSWYYQYLLTKDIAFKEIKIFNLGKYLKDQYKKLGMKFISQDKDLLEQKSRTQIFLILLEEVINSLILIYVVLKAFVGEILLGDLTTYTKSMSSVKSSAQSFLAQLNSIYENMLYISQYFEFMDKKGSYPTLSLEEKSKQSVQKDACMIPSIEIKNLCYRYKGQDHNVLHNLNLRIEQGNLVAFIGVNGSGKTTLVKILSTLYQDYQGEVFFGDHELRTLNPDRVRSKIGILFQDFVRYELSARENIAFGNLSKIGDTTEIEKIVFAVGLDKKLEDIDMQLGFWFDDGVQLSGGEWLKVALGRAFIRNADLYLLDEPNAALDAISEKRILRSFKELATGKIGIIISHRISSIKDIVNKIVVFRDGQIEAIGSHAELLQSSETYKELYLDEIAESETE